MTRVDGREVGLLHLLALYRRGDQIVAGLAAFPAALPVPRNLVGDRCGVDGCTSVIVAVSDMQLGQRIADHRDRCHG